MKWFFVWAAVFFPVVIRAHISPIYPNDVDLKVTHESVEFHFQSRASWWISDVFADQVPPIQNWTNDFQSKAQAYWDKHVVVTVDNKTLKSELDQFNYSEEIWRWDPQTHIRFRARYRLPMNAQQMRLRVTLYSEDLPEREKMLRLPSEEHFPMEFLTRIHIQGQNPRTVALSAEQPEITLPLASIRWTSVQLGVDRLKDGLLFWQIQPGLALLPWGLFLLTLSGFSNKTTRKGILGTLGVLSGASLYFYGFDESLAVLGGVLTLLMGTSCIWFILLLYRKHLDRESEAWAPTLWTSRVRMAGWICSSVGAYLLYRGF